MQSDRLIQKRVSIRREVRRQQLDELFANKRRIMLNNIDLENNAGRQMPDKQQNLVLYLQQLENDRNVEYSLYHLANFLVQNQPFLKFDGITVPSHALIQRYALHLVQLLCRKIILKYRSESRFDVQNRIAILTILSNLMADGAVENGPLCAEACILVRDVYDSLEIWGYDEETEEVGWLMGNLVGNQLADCDERDLQYILGWLQDMISTKESSQQMLANIYRNLSVFFSTIQSRYRLEPTQLPQTFKPALINLIQDTITRHCHDSSTPTLLVRVLTFLRNYVHLVAIFWPRDAIDEIIKKVVSMLGMITPSTVCGALALLQIMVDSPLSPSVPQYRKILQASERTKIIVVDKYSKKLLQLLCIRQTKIKIAIIRFIHRLLKSPSPSTYAIIRDLSGAGLEDTMTNLCKHNDQELIQECLHLGIIMSQLTDRTYGEQFLRQTEPSLSYQSMSNKPL